MTTSEISFSWKKDLIIAFSILLPFTILFWVTNLDIYIQSLFFDEQLGWFWIEHPFWDFIYRYGIFFGYAVALFSLVAISVSFWSPKFINWRKPAILMIFVIALGPGILINLTFKENWGRPRPRDVIELGGSQDFKYVWQMGEEGKSFPCGHCSMGFYFMIPYLFWRGRKQFLAYLSLSLGLVYGLIIGFARVLAGAHFPSDVLWSGGIVWLVGILGFYLFKVYKPIPKPQIDTQKQRKRARLITLLMGVFLPILTISLLLATPYVSKKELKISREELQSIEPTIQSLKLDLGYAEVNLKADENDSFHLQYKVNAFGFPNSKLRYDVILADTSSFRLYPTGWFTEIRNKIDVTYPLTSVQEYELLIQKGELILEIPETKQNLKFKILIEEGDVRLKINPENDFKFSLKAGKFENQAKRKIIQEDEIFYTNTNASVQLELDIRNGTLILED